jgi:hypothetical protein
MKKLIFIIALFTCFTSVYSQDKFKFGTCPVELLQKTSYEHDADAPAYVVYEQKEVSYDFSSRINDFQVVTNHTVRIKILTQSGVSEHAEASIAFQVGVSSLESENIESLTAYTYNLENGKVVREKLSKDYIFTEDVSKTIKRQKFAFSSVKIGSVIEYKYRHTSPFIYNIDEFEFQRTIPIEYGEFILRVPEYFSFNRETTGYESPEVKIKRINESTMIYGRNLSFTSEEITAKIKNFPALKDEPFLWNVNDFATKMTFDIKSVQFPGSLYRSYSNKWNNVAEKMMKSEGFGREFNNKGILKQEIPTALAGDNDTAMDSIRTILNLVRSKIKHNNRNSVWVDNQGKALKDGSGSSAEINAVLLNALKNAGFTAYPVAMSLRSRGRIPLTHPSLTCFNYFIVSVHHKDGVYYLDGTKDYTDINVIPTNCLVDRAMIIFSENFFEWVDLTSIGDNLNRVNMLLSFDSDGVLSGQMREVYRGGIAYQFKSRYDDAENEEKYIETTESKKNIEISDYTQERKTTPVYNFAETYNFKRKDFRTGDNIISFHPLLFLAMKENPFKSETREHPIEFSFPYEQRVDVLITIPDGYVVDELPASQKIIMDEKNQMELSYVIQSEGNRIQLLYRMKLNTCIVPMFDYDKLRDFWVKMYNKENELITLKKI